jgi:hypothetical protein
MASTYALPVEGHTRAYAYSPANGSHHHHAAHHGHSRSFNQSATSLLSAGSAAMPASPSAQQRQKLNPSPILEEGSAQNVRKATSESNLAGGMHAHHYSEGALSPNLAAFQPPLTAGPSTTSFLSVHSKMGRGRPRGESDLGRPAVKAAAAPEIATVHEHENTRLVDSDGRPDMSLANFLDDTAGP